MMFKNKFKIIFSLIIASLLLASCSTVRKDGPPRFNVDVSRIPNAVPKIEPLSRYGNKPYWVFGKKYNVLTSSKSYEEQGIASWYGTKFDSNKTSSGERYDMLAMTAAHKSLPLPTYVEVTNLSNNKKIVVKVNDRGPFKPHRIIDLSYVAAKKLGMLGRGTAKVLVKAIDPRQYKKYFNRENGGMFWSKKTTHHAKEHLLALHKKSTLHQDKKHSLSTVYLQVASFKNKKYADKLRKRLMTFALASPVSISESFTPEVVYRVQIGPIKNLSVAHEIKRQLQTAGLKSKPFIQHQLEI